MIERLVWFAGRRLSDRFRTPMGALTASVWLAGWVGFALDGILWLFLSVFSCRMIGRWFREVCEELCDVERAPLPQAGRFVIIFSTGLMSLVAITIAPVVMIAGWPVLAESERLYPLAFAFLGFGFSGKVPHSKILPLDLLLFMLAMRILLGEDPPLGLDPAWLLAGVGLLLGLVAALTYLGKRLWRQESSRPARAPSFVSKLWPASRIPANRPTPAEAWRWKARRLVRAVAVSWMASILTALSALILVRALGQGAHLLKGICVLAWASFAVHLGVATLGLATLDRAKAPDSTLRMLPHWDGWRIGVRIFAVVAILLVLTSGPLLFGLAAPLTGEDGYWVPPSLLLTLGVFAVSASTAVMLVRRPYRGIQRAASTAMLLPGFLAIVQSFVPLLPSEPSILIFLAITLTVLTLASCSIGHRLYLADPGRGRPIGAGEVLSEGPEVS